MGGGDGMSELSLVAALSPSCPIAKDTIPLSVLQAVRALDQELGEETEREALHAVVDSLVEWILLESTTPRSRDGTWCRIGQGGVCFPVCFCLSHDEGFGMANADLGIANADQIEGGSSPFSRCPLSALVAYNNMCPVVGNATT